MQIIRHSRLATGFVLCDVGCDFHLGASVEEFRCVIALVGSERDFD